MRNLPGWKKLGYCLQISKTVTAQLSVRKSIKILLHRQLNNHGVSINAKKYLDFVPPLLKQL